MATKSIKAAIKDGEFKESVDHVKKPGANEIMCYIYSVVIKTRLLSKSLYFYLPIIKDIHILNQLD